MPTIEFETYKMNHALFDELITDQFANYVFQKVLLSPFIEQEFIDLIFENFKGNVFKYSTDRHGCRVI